MKHDHSAFVDAGHNQAGCLLCTSTDREGLIEKLAVDLWDSRQIDDVIAWADAGEFWQIRFRELAETAVASLSSSPLS